MEKKVDRRDLDAALMDMVRRGSRRKRQPQQRQAPKKELPRDSGPDHKKLA